MEHSEKQPKLTAQQQRVLKLLFKFRFVSSQSLSDVMNIKRVSAYEALEVLVAKELVTKVYKKEYRIHGKPAYYYLAKRGVSTVRGLLDVKESVVHALYKNDLASDEYIEHCLTLVKVYTAIKRHLPEGTQIFTKSEINQFKQFPKNRPDLYIRTTSGNEAIVVMALEKTPYIIRKRMDEIIQHNENTGWDGDYPTICFVLIDDRAKNSLLYSTKKKLEGMGFDEDELRILATSVNTLIGGDYSVWSKLFKPSASTGLLG